jgi:hypothetical protein
MNEVQGSPSTIRPSQILKGSMTAKYPRVAKIAFTLLKNELKY